MDPPWRTALPGLTKRCWFSFALCFELCKLGPPALSNSELLPNLPCLSGPSHDCRVPQCLQRWKAQVQTLCQLMHFPLSGGNLARGCVSVFVFLSSTPLVFWNSVLSFCPVHLQQPGSPTFTPLRKSFSSPERHLGLLGNNGLQFCNCIFFFSFNSYPLSLPFQMKML